MNDAQRLTVLEEAQRLHQQSQALHTHVLEAHSQRLAKLDAIVAQQKRILAGLLAMQRRLDAMLHLLTDVVGRHDGA